LCGEFGKNGELQPMKWCVAAIGMLALAAFVFGWWGVFTEAGRNAYDEMDGIVPFISLASSAPLAVVAVALGFWSGFR
jgi:hypothetical protein